MASTTIEITGETEYVRDAIASLHMVLARLARRHGPEFRRLERMIEDIGENPDGCCSVHWIGGGRILAVPAGRMVEALSEAERLGLMEGDKA